MAGVDLRTACGEYDRCYGRAAARDSCDDDLGLNVGTDFFRQSYLLPVRAMGCPMLGLGYWAGVRFFGGKAYAGGQQDRLRREAETKLGARPR